MDNEAMDLVVIVYWDSPDEDFDKLYHIRQDEGDTARYSVFSGVTGVSGVGNMLAISAGSGTMLIPETYVLKVLISPSPEVNSEPKEPEVQIEL